MNYNEEEKEALDWLKGIVGMFYDFPNPQSITIKDSEFKYLEKIIDLIYSQKREIEDKDYLFHKALLDTINADRQLVKKNKMIELMTEELQDAKLAIFKKEDGGEFLGKYRCYNKEDWKQYFEKKVEE